MLGPRTPPMPTSPPSGNVTLPLLPSRSRISFSIPLIWPSLVTYFDQWHFGGNDNMWCLKPTALSSPPQECSRRRALWKASPARRMRLLGGNQEAPADWIAPPASQVRHLGTCQLSQPQTWFNEGAHGKSAGLRVKPTELFQLSTSWGICYVLIVNWYIRQLHQEKMCFPIDL